MPTTISKATKPKFKIGDTVVCIDNYDDLEIAGLVGTLASFNADVATISFKNHPQNGNFTWSMPITNIKPILPRKKISFDSVIVAEEKRKQILEALEQVGKADLIFEEWGFGETIEKGRGVNMLFYGEPGTGKTLMAQAIADKLNHKLAIIAGADIQSSAPGQSERNIREHFKNAKNKKVVLLFDECDSLLYNRSHVGPILGAQINELLTQLERYDGIVIFTTNRLGILDEAMNRRIALKLGFEMPSHAERIEIWKRMMPKKAPLAKDVDWARLAGVEITGGYIKNIVLRAARMAALQDVPDKDKKIEMVHLTAATKQEVTSMMEFNKAREEHEKGTGRVHHHAGSQPTVGDYDVHE